MVVLFLAVLAFGVVHVVPVVPAWKAQARATLGKAYGPAYGVASLVLLALALVAFRYAPSVDVYAPPVWGRHANMGLTLVAFLFVGVFLFRGSWRNAVGYPMMIAVALWATGHLIANGDGRSLLLFGGLAMAAIVQVMLSRKAGPRAPSEERSGHNMLSVLFGIAAYGVISQLHVVIAGVPVFDLSSFVH